MMKKDEKIVTHVYTLFNYSYNFSLQQKLIIPVFHIWKTSINVAKEPSQFNRIYYVEWEVKSKFPYI